MAARVWVRCFGAVRVEVDGEPVSLSADQQELVALLAIAGPAGIDSQALYDTIFANDPQKSGKQAVVMRLQRLRAKLPDSTITRGGNYGFEPERCRVDLWEFDATAAQAGRDPVPIATALNLWAEPFGRLAYSPAIIDETKERLHRLHRRLVSDFLGHVVPGYGEQHLDRALSLIAGEPHDEVMTGAAAAALFRLGRQTEALDLIAACRAGLLGKRGLDVGPELAATELAILRQDAVLLGPTSPVPRPAAPLPSDPEPDHPDRFVGRVDVLDRLSAAIGRPGPAIALLVAPSGFGKTYTIAQVLRTPIGAGHAVRVASADTSSNGPDQRPYGSWTRALPELSTDPATGDRDPESERARTWDRTTELLAEMSAGDPLILVLDDFHDADSQSQRLLRHIVSSPLPAGLRIIVSARPAEPGTAWHATLEVLEGRPDVERVDLEPLSIADITSLVALDHPREPPLRRDRFAQRLLTISGGSALVASRLSRDAPRGLDPALLPDAVTAESGLIEHLTRLVTDVEVAELMSAAALVGVEFDADLLADIVGRPPAEVDDLLAKARSLALCTPIDEHRWRFDHILIASAFADRLRLLRPLLFARLARHPVARAGSMVRYVAGAGSQLSPSEQAGLLAPVARAAIDRLAFAEASTALTLLLDAIEDDAPERMSVLTDLAMCASRSGAADEAAKWRAAAAELAAVAGDPTAVVAAALAGLPSGEIVGGEPDRLALLESVDLAGLEPAAAVAAADGLLRQARLLERLDVADRVIATIDPGWAEANPPAWNRLRTEQLMFDAAGPNAARVHGELAEMAAAMAPTPERAGTVLRALLAGLVEQRPSAAGPDFEAAVGEIEAHGSPRVRWAIEVLAASLSLVGLRPSASDAESARIAGVRWGIPDVYDSWGVQVWMQCWVAEDYATALALIDRAGNSITDNLAWHAGEALCAAHLGELRRARSEAARVVRGLTEVPYGNWAQICAALLAETAAVADLGDAARVASDLLAPRTGQAIVLGIGAAHFGPVDRYLALCSEVLGRPDAASLRARAIEQAESTGATHWVRSWGLQ